MGQRSLQMKGTLILFQRAKHCLAGLCRIETLQREWGKGSGPLPSHKGGPSSLPLPGVGRPLGTVAVLLLQRLDC